jgi:hypothetical protein
MIAVFVALTAATCLPAWALVFGRQWRMATGSGPNRADGAAVSHNGKLWFMGGMVSGAYYNNVWSTSNGQTPNRQPLGRRISLQPRTPLDRPA